MEKISWRRLLAIGGFIIAVIFFGYLLYATFFQTTPPATPGQPTNGPSGQLPTIPEGGPTGTTTLPIGLPLEGPGSLTQPTEVAQGGVTKTNLIVNSPTVGVAENGNFIDYYQATDGKFYRLSADGQPTLLSDKTFFGVNEVTWSPNHTNAVLEYPDGTNIAYDFKNNKQLTLPQHWEDFSYDPSGEQLAFKSLGADPGARWLAISDSNGTQQEAIQALGDKGSFVTVDWSPAQQIVASYRQPSGADRQELFFIGKNNENLRSTVVPGVGFASKWTPDGQHLLFSTSGGATGYRPNLWFVAASGENIGQNRQNLGVETWADKCTFKTATNIICAVPQYLPDGAGLARNISRDIPDDLYEIDLANGQKTLLARPNINLSVSNLQLTSDGAALFMQDAKSGRLYKIAL